MFERSQHLGLSNRAPAGPTGAGHQAARALVTRNEEQPIQVGELHSAPAVGNAGQRGRPHRAEEDQVIRGLNVRIKKCVWGDNHLLQILTSNLR